jgi:hypothetical protein
MRTLGFHNFKMLYKNCLKPNEYVLAGFPFLICHINNLEVQSGIVAPEGSS